MQLRPYQLDTLDKLKKELIASNEVVVAAAPNSGKTFMATSFIKDNPEATFLILTHGTIVLEKQWHKALEAAGVPHSKIPGQYNVTYGLPQTLSKKIGHEFDYLVVDEAHEFYFAAMVQKIKTETKPKKVILLTGTPSKFIRRGYSLITVAALDLIKQGYSSDLYIGMVSTTANLKDSDHNDKGDLSTKGEKKIEKTVNQDMKELLKQIQLRLTELEHIKIDPLPKNSRSHWANSLSHLQKTMFKCSSIKQAELVTDYLKNEGVETILSHSLLDPDSGNIEKFKEDDNIIALVVVDRAILGFDMEDLVNVVDLSCSKNIDRIYQLYARVMRKSDKHLNKYFFKFAPEGGMELHKWYMNAALQLMDEDFISSYNGKNLEKMDLPVQLIGKSKNSSGNKRTGTMRSRSDFEFIDEIFKSRVGSGSFLLDIKNQVGSVYNEYAYVRFSQILHKKFGIEFPVDYSTCDTTLKDLVSLGIINGE